MSTERQLSESICGSKHCLVVLSTFRWGQNHFTFKMTEFWIVRFIPAPALCAKLRVCFSENKTDFWKTQTAVHSPHSSSEKLSRILKESQLTCWLEQKHKVRLWCLCCYTQLWRLEKLEWRWYRSHSCQVGDHIMSLVVVLVWFSFVFTLAFIVWSESGAKTIWLWLRK